MGWGCGHPDCSIFPTAVSQCRLCLQLWAHPGSKVPQIPREASGILHTLAQLGTEQGQGESPCTPGSSQQPRNGALCAVLPHKHSALLC